MTAAWTFQTKRMLPLMNMFGNFPVPVNQPVARSALSFPLQRSRIFDDFFSDFDQTWGKTVSEKIQLDVKESDKMYEILADLPGATKESTEIEVKDGFLIISTERKKIEKREDEAIRREERFTGFSSRSLLLPEDADEEKIDATFENGVLKITIQKSPKPESKVKKISIK